MDLERFCNVTVGDFNELINKKGALGLGLVERMILLFLPQLVDDYGCLLLDFRRIRHHIFPDSGVTLTRVWFAFYRLSKRGLIRIFKTNCRKRIVYAKYLEGLMPDSTNNKPSLPLPDFLDWVVQDDGSIKIVRMA